MDSLVSTARLRPAGVDDRAASPFMTRRETAQYLNASEKWLAQSGRAGGPAYYKFGSSCRYRIEDVINWAKQQRVAH